MATIPTGYQPFENIVQTLASTTASTFPLATSGNVATVNNIVQRLPSISAVTFPLVAVNAIAPVKPFPVGGVAPPPPVIPPVIGYPIG